LNKQKFMNNIISFPFRRMGKFSLDTAKNQVLNSYEIK